MIPNVVTTQSVSKGVFQKVKLCRKYTPEVGDGTPGLFSFFQLTLAGLEQVSFLVTR